MKKKLSYLVLVITLCVLNACKVVQLEEAPDKGVTPPVGKPVSEAAFVSALTNNDNRKWNALTFQLEGLKGFQKCRLDDTFTFFKNGTYRYDGGKLLCGGADNKFVKTGIWEVDFKNLKIIFDKGTSLETSAVLSGLQEDKMELQGEVEVFGKMLDIRGIYEYAK